MWIEFEYNSGISGRPVVRTFGMQPNSMYLFISIQRFEWMDGFRWISRVYRECAIDLDHAIKGHARSHQTDSNYLIQFGVYKHFPNKMHFAGSEMSLDHCRNVMQQSHDLAPNNGFIFISHVYAALGVWQAGKCMYKANK